MIKHVNIEQLQINIKNGETFAINLTADWCSDCTDQALNLAGFAALLAVKGIGVNSIAMQKDKNSYLSSEHQHFTESVGGHGFPRTVLVINGQVVDADNVEVITSEQLNELAQQFLQQV